MLTKEVRFSLGMLVMQLISKARLMVQAMGEPGGEFPAWEGRRGRHSSAAFGCKVKLQCRTCSQNPRLSRDRVALCGLVGRLRG